VGLLAWIADDLRQIDPRDSIGFMMKLSMLTNPLIVEWQGQVHAGWGDVDSRRADRHACPILEPFRAPIETAQ
jgi:hypothetical protein